jgi:hypothetical protein
MAKQFQLPQSFGPRHLVLVDRRTGASVASLTLALILKGRRFKEQYADEAQYAAVEISHAQAYPKGRRPTHEHKAASKEQPPLWYVLGPAEFRALMGINPDQPVKGGKGKFRLPSSHGPRHLVIIERSTGKAVDSMRLEQFLAGERFGVDYNNDKRYACVELSWSADVYENGRMPSQEHYAASADKPPHWYILNPTEFAALWADMPQPEAEAAEEPAAEPVAEVVAEPDVTEPAVAETVAEPDVTEPAAEAEVAAEPAAVAPELAANGDGPSANGTEEKGTKRRKKDGPVELFPKK